MTDRYAAVYRTALSGYKCGTLTMYEYNLWAIMNVFPHPKVGIQSYYNSTYQHQQKRIIRRIFDYGDKIHM